MPMNRKPIGGLYVLTDTSAGSSKDVLSRVEAVLRGGATMIQYRDKSGDQPRRRQEALAMQALCHRHGAVLIINDDIDLAADIGADGVHLGRDDAKLQHARELLGNTAIIGASCYDSLPLAHQAVAAGADYVAFGSFFPSAIKPEAVSASLELLQEARQQLQVPIVAIGGIDADNAETLLEAGADALAVISAVFLAEDPHAKAQQLARMFH